MHNKIFATFKKFQDRDKYFETLVIGDVHGKVNEYNKILNKYPSFSSVQIGDFGFKEAHEWHKKNVDPNKHKILFGNHDDYDYFEEKYSLFDTSLFLSKDIFSIRGAFSIDKNQRVLGCDYFANEELNYIEMKMAIYKYSLYKPKTVISHDCPQSIRECLFGIEQKSSTSIGLQQMLEIHQPKTWIFGHHHKSINEEINGTRFICLAELETFFI